MFLLVHFDEMFDDGVGLEGERREDTAVLGVATGDPVLEEPAAIDMIRPSCNRQPVCSSSSTRTDSSTSPRLTSSRAIVDRLANRESSESCATAAWTRFKYARLRVEWE